MNNRGYEDLANAIVLSGIEEYKRALIQLHRNPDNERAKQAAQDGERFLYSDWFEMLTDLRPDYLIQKLKDMIEEKYG